MSLQRKQIILNEISFWKKNKLLPEHYCDFLTALYAQGEQAEEVAAELDSVLAKKNKTKLFLQILIGLVTVILISSLLLVTSTVLIPIVTTGIAICILLYICIKLAKNKSTLTQALMISTALLLLAVSFKIWDAYFFESPAILIGIIVGNCLIWLFSGLMMKLIYFSISGILGIIFMFVYVALYYL